MLDNQFLEWDSQAQAKCLKLQYNECVELGMKTEIHNSAHSVVSNDEVSQQEMLEEGVPLKFCLCSRLRQWHN